jgi:hypothetical protein
MLIFLIICQCLLPYRGVMMANPEAGSKEQNPFWRLLKFALFLGAIAIGADVLGKGK